MTAAKMLCKTRAVTSEALDENQKVDSEIESTLLPGLPNHVAQLCLSRLQASLLYDVCTSWRRFIYSPGFPSFLSLYALLIKVQSDASSLGGVPITFVCFDPVSFRWRPLPDPPSNPPLCVMRRHPSFITRVYPIQSIVASGRLVLLAANTHEFLPALTHPLAFNPLTSEWIFGPPFFTPRRWCVAGSKDGKVYIASGTSARYNSNVARSLERWDILKSINEWSWEKRAPLRDGRFSREAIEALGFKDKLFMVNVKGKSTKEGTTYNVVNDCWEEMPQGMLRGWTGPATMDDDGEVMYVVDQENGSLHKYNADRDCWERLTEPLEYLKGAEHVAASRGKVCVVSGDGRKIVVVDVLATPPKVWALDPPQGMEAIAVHILPRMSLQSSE